ncbi:uncharacterized protein LOC128558706 [Mercenaria mercenaria]|uniref:uncharacterized protein LOC128558706 n=1 Tax=Mercenaria mercenaria TaxID=6596 RepID=UPI00234E7D6F|nr:uncharacterized protein LOC128558706 [Mercenaria mercenaria]XP_053404827.1 uncharacterized protein LOC128558706 [Mercenaria mercenaria]XP_053404828.1 uncharacterized protein LOC128558706 [Mercenaria mercenaria]XP_053404829.1 uncharacterized protein LOC128558706 [Mercenaria mercenaria]XP_053404830.1 uncharacterized protein LOC128558706 [Mercenaria mercenaria]XP_053404831.1 uncharacterized protein LOC128558706 [Mercenaria mercenaria]XP_053404832.1 uncharacterized protein LOC128558706 [Mercen
MALFRLRKSWVGQYFYYTKKIRLASAPARRCSCIETVLNSDLEKISSWANQWLVNFNPSKTEVMFFSFRDIAQPSLTFDNTPLNFVDDHKHLGLTISHDCSWHTHIINITSSASKVLSSMRMLKFKVKRSTLNNIYILYLRPLLEYASVVWDSCTQYEKDTIEKLQYEAARIVTGLTRSVSIQNLLTEVGWVSLADRRIMQKLILAYKGNNGLLPDYLIDIFPPTVHNSNNYELRNNTTNFVTLPSRLEIYSKSVIPDSVKLWNNLDSPTHNANTLTSFKSKLKNKFKSPIVPSFYLIGERFYNVVQTRIRNRCSNLNNDLFYNHLRDYPDCSCGHGIEDAEHFFFKCSHYADARRLLFINTRRFHPLSTHKLLHGIDSLTIEENKSLFLEVQTYIKSTHRFSSTAS